MWTADIGRGGHTCRRSLVWCLVVITDTDTPARKMSVDVVSGGSYSARRSASRKILVSLVVVVLGYAGRRQGFSDGVLGGDARARRPPARNW